jgi:hypothetical protein
MVVFNPSSNQLNHQRLILSLYFHSNPLPIMSSPTHQRSQFTPSRSAPPPPTYATSQRSHSNGPFIPYALHYHQGHSHSTTSLDSASTLFSSERTPSTPSASSHAARSPLNTPLSSPTRPKNIQGRSISYPSAIPSSPSPKSPKYSHLPAELSLFDHRPRQTLLADIEFIIGKKLHFPMLSSKKKEKKEKAQQAGAKLKKEKRISDDDVFWSGVRREDVVVIEKKKGRGVREGNWI